MSDNANITGSAGIKDVGFYCEAESTAYEEKWRRVFRKNEAELIYMDITLYRDNNDVGEREIDIKLMLIYEEKDALSEEIREKIVIPQDYFEYTFTVCFNNKFNRTGKYAVKVDVDGYEAESPDVYIVDIPNDYSQCFELEDFSFYRRNVGEEVTDYKQNTLTGINIDQLGVIDIFFMARNKLEFEWTSEFCISVFDQRGMLVTERVWRTGEPIDGGKKEQFHFFVNIGDGEQSFWHRGNFRVEVLFMGELIIEAPFTIGNRNVAMPFNPLTVQPRRLHGGKQVIAAGLINTNPLDEINTMIGLQQLKKELKRYVDKVQYNKARQRAGYSIKPIALHSVYLGNPGTGKTTVARLMGKVFHDLGLLSKGHVVVEERNSLTGKFYGSEEEKTTEALQRASGGVLFIDEAYTLLVKEDPKDPGRRIIETLLTTMSDENNRDICVILAGYPDPMIDMLNDNPGMKSRLPNVYHFDDYSVDELMQIADSYLDKNEYKITGEAREALRVTVENAYSKRDSKFGNGRYIITLLENRIIPNLASRLVATGNLEEIEHTEHIILIEKEDVDNMETETKDADYFRIQRKSMGFQSIKTSFIPQSQSQKEHGA